LPHRISSESVARWNSGERFTESVLIITGAMGAGKSSVLAEASDILALRRFGKNA
jgi:predicted ATPase